MKLQEFQDSKCSYPATIPFAISWSDDDKVAMATNGGVYVTKSGMWRRIASFTLFTVILMLTVINETEGGDFTNAVFGGKTDGVPAAFGDFNSDEYPDLFVINRDRKSIDILLGAENEPPYLRENKNFHCDFDYRVTSIVPGDFDGDAIMDVLVTLQTDDSNLELNSVVILWGNGSEALDCSHKKNILLTLKGQPLAMDYHQDMIIDLFGISVHNKRKFWEFRNKTGPSNSSMLSGENRQYDNLRIPHSHAFLDLNGDSAADLLLTGEHEFEIWLWDKKTGKFEYNSSSIPMPGSRNAKIGQSLLLDIELKGKMDLLLPVCFNDNCSNSTLYVYSNDNKWHNLQTAFFEGTNKWGFVPPMKDELFLEAITLHGGDFNMDGYPDLLATLQHDNIRKTFLLENVECTTNCNDFSRKFVVNWQALEPFNNNTRMGVFYDFLQDGVLDIIFVHDDLHVSAFKNSLDYDANFVKVMVITGLKERHQPVIPGPLGGRKNRTYGTNLPGPKIAYQTTTQEGNSRAAVAAQLPQSAYFCLHLPYTLFGLGRTPNFVDDLLVGVSGHFRHWPQIIPNSQMVVIPQPLEYPQKWTARLFVTPSKLIVQSFIALLATCLFISLIIAILYWRERREDNYEKFHFLY